MVTLFGCLIVTLTSGVSMLLLIVALSAFAFIGWTVFRAWALSIGGGRRPRIAAAGSTFLALVVALSGLRIESSGFATLVVCLATAAAVGPLGAWLSLG